MAMATIHNPMEIGLENRMLISPLLIDSARHHRIRNRRNQPSAGSKKKKE